MKKRLAGAALAAALATGAGAGAVLGAPTTAFADEETASEATASQDNTSTKERRSPQEWMNETLQSLVDDGTITEDQRTAVVETLESERPEPPERGHGPGHGPRMDGPPSEDPGTDPANQPDTEAYAPA
jgi:opacity protein-like surface antigen